MFSEIMNIVLTNLIMVGLFLIPLFLIRTSDICLGISLARKESVDFNWKKFGWGIWHSFCFIVGLALFVTSISMIIPLVTEYGIKLDDELLNTFNTINSISVCIIILTTTVKSYGVDCFNKVNKLVNDKNK